MQSTVRPVSGQNQPSEYSEMQAIASIAQFSRALVRREQYRAGGDSVIAIKRVASRLKTGPGTLTNIIKKRVKTVCFSLGQRIIAAAVSDIENERKQLEHEHQAIVAMGQNADPSALAKVEEGLSIAREGLAEMRAAR